jgi:hypothetical protein
MAATATWYADHGTQTGSPTKGTSRDAASDVNWKNADVQATAYTAAPITSGSHSFEIWLSCKFTASSFNNISAGLFAHTLTAFGSNLTLKGPASCTSDGTRLLYTTPSTTANTNLTTDMTTAVAIGSGVTVYFSATGPEATGKAATLDGTVDRYTNFLTTQLQTAAGVAAGDTAQVTLTLQYNEN